MLKKTKSMADISQMKVTTVIGEDTTIEGNLKASGTTRIDGVVKGEVISEGNIIIGLTGKIWGNIKAGTVFAAGQINGDISALVKIEVASTGKIIGDIHTKSLIIDENAVFHGACNMQGDTEATERTIQTESFEVMNEEDEKNK